MSENGFGEVFELYNFDYAQKLSGAGEEERLLRNRIAEMAETFLRAHIEAVASKVSSLELHLFGRRQVEHAKMLQLKLQSDLPIASLRESAADEIHTKLNSLAEMKATRERVYEVLAELNEVPATSSEILAAGWLYKLASFEERLKEIFPFPSSAMLDLNDYGKYLNRMDELLLMSIQGATVHTSMIRR